VFDKVHQIPTALRAGGHRDAECWLSGPRHTTRARARWPCSALGDHTRSPCRADLARRRSDRTVYDNLADMCATVDIEHGDRILDCNATLANMLGFTKEELIGKVPPRSIFPANSEARELAHSTLRRASALHDIERVLIRKDGRRIEASLSATALHLGVMRLRSRSQHLRGVRWTVGPVNGKRTCAHAQVGQMLSWSG
jgi:PAS domain S-box-containing protein